MTRFGMSRFGSQSARCARMSPALTTSGTSCFQPGYSRTSSRSSDGIRDVVLYLRLSMSRCAATSLGCCAYSANMRERTLSDDLWISGAYSPKTVTVLFFARAASQRNPPDEYVSGSSSSDG